MAKTPETPIDGSVAPPDVTVGGNPITDAPANANLFDAAGCVSPSQRTEGAVMPDEDSRPEKRGRGRPRKEGDVKRSHIKKKTPTQTEAQGTASAQLIVGALDLLRAGISGGECAPNVEMRGMTVDAWREYLAQNNWEVPAWVQVCVISSMYVAPAFSTPQARGRLSGAFAKIKGWWIARKG